MIVAGLESRYVPDVWSDGNKSITFEYATSTLLLDAAEAKEGTTDAQRFVLDYQTNQETWGGAAGVGVTTHPIRLKSASGACSACTRRFYEYDEGRVSRVKDGDTPEANILVGRDYDSVGRLVKVFRQPYGGTEQLVERYIYDDATPALAYLRYQDATHAEVTIYGYDSSGGTMEHRTTTVFADPIDLSAPPVPPFNFPGQTSYTSTFASFPDPSEILHVETKPDGITEHRSYLAMLYTSMAIPGTADYYFQYHVARTSVFDGEKELVLAERTYCHNNPPDQNCYDGIELQSVTDAHDATTEFSYDLHRVKEERRPWVRLLPASGETEGAFGRERVRFEYDEGRQVPKEEIREWVQVDQDGASTVVQLARTTYEYDSAWNVTRMTEDPDVPGGEAELNLITEYAYDYANRLTETRRSIQTAHWSRHVRKYTSDGSLEREYTLRPFDSRAEELTVYEYDAVGRLSKRRVALFDEPLENPDAFAGPYADTLYEYDVFGRKTAVREDPDGLNLTTRYEYDYQDRVIKVTAPDGAFTGTAYNGRGNIRSETVSYEGAAPGEALITTYSYDANGNLTEVVAPTGVRTCHTYDAFDRRVVTQRKPASEACDPPSPPSSGGGCSTDADCDWGGICYAPQTCDPESGCQPGALLCAAPTPVCDVPSDRCVGCLGDSDCSAPTFRCEPTSKTCVACLEDAHCAEPTPVCDTSVHVCVDCLNNTHCSSPTPVCRLTSKTCVMCLTTADCPPQAGCSVTCAAGNDCLYNCEE